MGVITDEIRILIGLNGASSYVNNMRQVTGSTNTFNASASKLMSTLSKFISAAVIFNFAKQSKEAWQVQLEAETKLNTILVRNIGATKEQVEATKRWASELQEVGVIGDEIQLSGLQELATYIDNADSLRTMNVVLNDMLAQQYGLNATAENAVTISTMLGKVLEGQTSALSRYGYSFNEAQEQLLKFGTEEQRVATLAEVVESSVGGINEALAKTPAGKLKQISNTMGDIKEQFGRAIVNTEAAFVPVLKMTANVFENISKVAVAISESAAIKRAAETVRLYGEAWKNASDQTKGLVKASVSVFAIMAVAPRIIAIVSAGVRLLSMEIVTLGGALEATMGILGIVLGAIAFKRLTDQVKELKKASETAESISDIGTSAEASSNAVDDLAEAMNGLGDATEGLDTFLASFDEVNKVGGNKSLMSNLINTDDLANILGVADGLEDINDMVDTLNGSLDSLDMGTPSIEILEPDWWKRKWEGVKGFIATLFNPSEFWENWEIGAEEIVTALHKVFPKITEFLTKVGAAIADVFKPAIEKVSELAQKIEGSAWFKYFANAGSNAYDLVHENDEEKDDTFMYTSKSGVTRPALKYNTDGSETELYKKYKSMYNEDGSETELNKRLQRSSYSLNQPNIPNLSQIMNATYQQPNTTIINNYTTPEKKEEKETTVEFSPTIQIDGRTISSIVINEINKRTRSSGKSPLIELGG